MMTNDQNNALRKYKHNRLTIGVLAGWQTYSGTINSFLEPVFNGIRSVAQNNGINLLIGCGVQSSASAGLWNTALPLIEPGVDFIPVGPWNTDGIIIAAPILSPVAMAYLQKLDQEGFPIVYAGDHDASPAVLVDNEGGILQAFDHLVQHGHQHIAFIAGHSNHRGDTTCRLEGYRMGLAKHGFAYDPDLVSYGQHDVSNSYQATMEIIARGKPFTAVICSNDDTAVGAMNALRHAGLNVPQDVAVIGFDDRLESKAQIPLLTTVRHPMFELGVKSIQLLSQIIQGQAPHDTIIRIPTNLIIRESCGCLPGAHKINASLDASQTETLNPGIDLAGQPHSTPTSARAVHPAPVSRDEQQLQIVQKMADAADIEMQQLSRNEIEYLCSRLLDTFLRSLKQGDPSIFRQAIQQILEHIAAKGDDLYAWQGAISVIHDCTPELQKFLPDQPASEQIDQMLHQARIAISEVSRGQYSRRLAHQTYITQQISQMTAHFLAAKSETDVFSILDQYQSRLDISAAVVALYDPEPPPHPDPTQADKKEALVPPFTWSTLKLPQSTSGSQSRFMTRQFPPEGLFPPDQPFDLVVLPLNTEEGNLGFAAFATTGLEFLGTIISQLVAALRSVRLYQDAVEARRMAEEANYLKSRFLSIVSHELRTPLNLIYGLSNMMLEQSRQVNEQECVVNQKDLERIDVGAKHLESLIRDVLDLARSDLGELKLVPESLDLTEVLQAVSVIGEQLATDKKLDWRTDLPASLPRVNGDRTRLRQIVLNLVNNAIKFTDKGSVKLSAYEEDEMVKITVQDTGLGIPLDEQCAIFDEFRQSRRTTARGYGGMGLGLAICKRLVEMHHGQIGVTSTGEMGSGSTFFIKLPVSEPAGAVDLPTPDTPQAQRVLLLAKDKNSGLRLSQHLIQQGFQVEVHLPEKLCNWTKWFQTQPPDKLLLDKNLTPDHSWDIYKKLKENPATANIPVFFYQIDSDQDTGSMLDLEMLTKPLNADALAGELISRGLVPANNHSSNHKSILVVDDDPGILDLHTRMLETLASGYSILQAHDGCEALDIVQKERPALVLLDLMMPRMDGFTVLERMQAEESTSNIPVIVLTSQVLTEEDMARLNTGVASVLSKGMYSAQETLAHITAALSRNHRTGSETQRLVMKAVAYLHTHYQDPVTRGDVALYVGVSERHLSRCFQQEVGLTPMEYLNRFRVNMAKSLLRRGQMTITDVALEVGFSSGGYFTRVFRDEVGDSPRDFMRNCGPE